MAEFAFRLWHEKEGQGMVEYALILALITLLAVVSMRNVAAAASRIYTGTALNIAHSNTPGQPGNEGVTGSTQGGWSQSGGGSPLPAQNNAGNNIPNSSTR